MSKNDLNNYIDFMEMSHKEFADARVFNEFIRSSVAKYVGFVNSTETNADEVQQVLEDSGLLHQYDVVVFGENVPQECNEYENSESLSEIVAHFDINVFAMVCHKSAFGQSGSFNEKLSWGADYELLCRMSEYLKICFVPCVSECGEKNKNVLDGGVWDGCHETMAYVLKRNMSALQASGRLNDIFASVTAHMQQIDRLAEFNNLLTIFLDGGERFLEIECNTAPFFVIMGDGTCHGVLEDFAVQLVDELIDLGQAVVTSKGTTGRPFDIKELQNVAWKGIIGFQAPALNLDYIRNIPAKKFQFWFDNPIFIGDVFDKCSKDCYVLCQDGLYAEYLKEFFELENAMHFPPAGHKGDYYREDGKELDVVFIGTYNDATCDFLETKLKAAFYEYMISHWNLTFEDGFRGFIKESGLTVPKEDFRKVLESLRDVCRKVINFYRKKVVDVILAAGIPLHVYGDSWTVYEGQYKDNLVIHPAVNPEESMEIMSRAKVSLNVMTWHKAGMTERVANSMFAGAVCLSDETSYLREHFSKDEIVLFELGKLDEVPDMINRILNEDEYRKMIVRNAYKKAKKEHTWKKRAVKLLELAENKVPVQ